VASKSAFSRIVTRGLSFELVGVAFKNYAMPHRALPKQQNVIAMFASERKSDTSLRFKTSLRMSSIKKNNFEFSNFASTSETQETKFMKNPTTEIHYLPSEQLVS